MLHSHGLLPCTEDCDCFMQSPCVQIFRSNEVLRKDRLSKRIPGLCEPFHMLATKKVVATSFCSAPAAGGPGSVRLAWRLERALPACRQGPAAANPTS